jgi:Secretion system C-terminal sorting domain
LIHEETLTSGGNGTAKDITATIPATFAGKTIGLIIRHFDCMDQNQLLVDDFEVSYNTSLSIEDHTLEIAGVYPNPVKDVLKIKTNEIVDGISITNQLGQRVMEISKNVIANNMVDLSRLTKGLYIMTVRAANKSQSIKIIKE